MLDFGLFNKSAVKADKVELKKFKDEASFQKSTPFPSLDYIASGGGKGTGGMQTHGRPDLLINIPLLYEAARNSNELRIIFDALKREIFRNGFEFEPDWLARCPKCEKDFEYEAIQCDECGEIPTLPNFGQIKHIEKFIKRVNVNKQSLKEVCDQLEDDFQTADEIFMVLVKEYTYSPDGEIVAGKIEQIVRGAPYNFSIISDKKGRIGYNESEQLVMVCPEHREMTFDVDEEDPMTTHCPRCGKRLRNVHYVELADDSGGYGDVYYLEGEVIHESKYHPTLLRGYPPIISVWNKSEALRAMDLYIKDYYGKQRPPKGMLLINTKNTDELRKMWAELIKNTQGNPHLIHPIGVDSNSSRGSVAQYIDFMNTLTENQYGDVRRLHMNVMGARFGVMPLYQGDLSNAGGLNNEGLQITVTNRAVEFGQEIWNERVFPRLLEEFGVKDFKLVLLPSEEQDEMADEQLFAQRAANAAQMLSMGFEVSLTEQGDEFKFKGEAKPMQQPGLGGLGGELDTGNFDNPLVSFPGGSQSFSSEPSIGKAKMPRFLDNPMTKELKAMFESVIKRFNLKSKPGESEMKKIISSVVGEVKKRLRTILDSQLDATYKTALKGVESELKVKIGFGKPDQNALKVLKEQDVFKGVFDNMETSMKKNLLEGIEKFYAEPGSLNSLVDNLSESVDLQRSRLETIARTETQHVSTLARAESYKKVDPRGERLFKWIGPTDSRTTAVCKEITNLTKKGVKLKELKRIISEVAKKYGFKARDFTPHYSCRHTHIILPK